MSSLFQAIAFFTRIPVPTTNQKDDFAKCAMWFPVVGLLLGGILALFDWLFSFCFPNWIRAVLDVGIWIYLTGGLHLDGLMDTADGLGSYRTRERILEIMHDSRVGAMGVLAAILLILLKVSSIASLPLGSLTSISLVMATLVSRFIAVWAIFIFPYVRKQGIGVEMKNNLTWIRFLFACLITLVASFLLVGWENFIILLFVGAFASVYAWRVQRRLGGLTGDVYGALIESSEVFILLIMIVWEVSPYARYLA
ncbi:adenosylcobinamide-GDP ribazoletransferase [Thermoflavimicrobium daqui]|jgi:adenosylcobinamide-GDP ribazoletransferase|uniref:Adenosylcobinamide-GDP ribazoletransferase n=1 Tax=Thermoflavimicrobium daqui TaxID=2137476 RepID=A0A364K5N6_9BACL|nr:adenosylcobinamide-GDP ribazoletransferase [Thermoflavimicrobium daqui]RAL25621.1 adenosylcobinamide-GDP ribazoletransferase [Thermoflavimicrobium daqui]